MASDGTFVAPPADQLPTNGTVSGANSTAWLGCIVSPNAIMAGTVVKTLDGVASAEACCRACRNETPCNVYTYCNQTAGCTHTLGPRTLSLAPLQCERLPAWAFALLTPAPPACAAEPAHRHASPSSRPRCRPLPTQASCGSTRASPPASRPRWSPRAQECRLWAGPLSAFTPRRCQAFRTSSGATSLTTAEAASTAASPSSGPCVLSAACCAPVLRHMTLPRSLRTHASLATHAPPLQQHPRKRAAPNHRSVWWLALPRAWDSDARRQASVSPL